MIKPQKAVATMFGLGGSSDATLMSLETLEANYATVAASYATDRGTATPYVHLAGQTAETSAIYRQEPQLGSLPLCPR